MSYVPGAIPDETPDALKAWLADELRRIAASLNVPPRAVPRTTAPNNPRNGDIAYAAGDWATALGAAGFYGYEEGAWRPL
jgi:hypothetical protein